MAGYRFYFTSDQGKVLAPSIEAECADDVRALAKAGELARVPSPLMGYVEVWDRGRFVGRMAVGA